MWPGERHLGQLVRRALILRGGSSKTWPQEGNTPARRISESVSAEESGSECIGSRWEGGIKPGRVWPALEIMLLRRVRVSYVIGHNISLISERRAARISGVRNSSSFDGGDVVNNNTELALTMILHQHQI
jgi:hypothetical protein